MLKTILIILALVSLPAIALANDSTATFKVTGWHCEGCTAKTEQLLKEVPGVTAVKTDLGKGFAEVTFDDSKTTVAQLEKAVVSAGFKVSK